MMMFLNCQGSSLSHPSSVSSLLLFFSGCQSVQYPRTGLMYSCWTSRQRRQSTSSASTSPASGFSRAHTMPASTAEVTCRAVAFWLGARSRVDSMSSCEPYQQAFLACPQSSTPSSSIPVTTSRSRIFQSGLSGGQPLPRASRQEVTASSQGWQAQWQVGRQSTLPSSLTVKKSAMEMDSSWVTRKPSWGPGVGHQLLTITFMPGSVRQIEALHPSRCSRAFLGIHFSCVPQPSSEGWWQPSAMKPSTDQVFQKAPIGLKSLLRWVSRSAMWTPFTPRFFMRRAQSLLVLGSSSMGNCRSRARLTRACLTNQLTMPGLAPQQETAVVLRLCCLTSRSNFSRRPQLLRWMSSSCLSEQWPSHSSLTVSTQSTPFSWQYLMISREEVPTDRLTQKSRWPVKTRSRTYLQLWGQRPIRRNLTLSLSSGRVTGSGSMMVMCLNSICFLIRGRVPFPIDP